MYRIKYFGLVLLLLVSCSSVEEKRTTLAGKYTWGHEVNTIQLCGSDLVFWVQAKNEIYWLLREFHQSNTMKPYESVFIRFIGSENGKAEDGFAADYDGLYKIESVNDMQAEIPKDC
ncbi:MAG: hypothetical protein KZQ93_14695 [Candidatus Thiodiazotropha sp. (ex Monitilora ramsayi)]|nr:hypothetical protein [Candidatus Thiodiazotropha sp. (ex Monitilora ramsayi)]